MIVRVERGFELRGTVALVTGASRRAGIGAAVCRALAERGAAVAFTHFSPADRAIGLADEDGPEALVRELRGAGARAAAVEADLADPAAAPRVFDAIERELGGPCAVLVNNAAWSDREDGVEALAGASIDAHLAVNVRAPMLLAGELARRLPASAAGGRIVNLTTGWARGPMPGELAYTASKGAVEAFTVQLAAELAARAITVNAVDPGPTDTGWMDARTRTELAARSPRGRVGAPEDAARLIAWLAGSEAGWVTGQVIHSSGGFE